MSRIRRGSRRFALVAANAGLLGVLLVGCGGGGGDDPDVASVSGAPSGTATGAPGNDRDRALKYAACLREHGLDVPDPEPGVNGNAFEGAPEEPGSAQARAMEACASLRPDGGQLTKDDPKAHDDQLKLAKCLRDNGVEVRDPQPGEPMVMPFGPNGDTTKLDAAMAKCGQQSGAQGAQPR